MQMNRENLRGSGVKEKGGEVSREMIEEVEVGNLDKEVISRENDQEDKILVRERILNETANNVELLKSILREYYEFIAGAAKKYKEIQNELDELGPELEGVLLDEENKRKDGGGNIFIKLGGSLLKSFGSFIDKGDDEKFSRWNELNEQRSRFLTRFLKEVYFKTRELEVKMHGIVSWLGRLESDYIDSFKKSFEEQEKAVREFNEILDELGEEKEFVLAASEGDFVKLKELLVKAVPEVKKEVIGLDIAIGDYEQSLGIGFTFSEEIWDEILLNYDNSVN